MIPYSLILAGSTERTVKIATHLLSDARFNIIGVLTPAPKPQGRKKAVTQNPLHTFAITNDIPTVLIQKKINEEIRGALAALPQPDILVVVDFGYIVPRWLLDLPSL